MGNTQALQLHLIYPRLLPEQVKQAQRDWTEFFEQIIDRLHRPKPHTSALIMIKGDPLHAHALHRWPPWGPRHHQD